MMDLDIARARFDVARQANEDARTAVQQALASRVDMNSQAFSILEGVAKTAQQRFDAARADYEAALD